MNFSWIEEEERLLNLKENSSRENLQTIELVSIYINQQDEIETVERETMDISISEQETNKISKSQIMEWRDQRVKFTPNSKFILKDLLLFHVPIEPENISEIKSNTNLFMNKYTKTVFSKSTLDLDDILIPPAIFIFHSLSTLFFFFHEIPNTIPNPIIKTIHKNTKKTVKINIPNKTITNKKIRITRKQMKEQEIHL